MSEGSGPPDPEQPPPGGQPGYGQGPGQQPPPGHGQGPPPGYGAQGPPPGSGPYGYGPPGGPYGYGPPGPPPPGYGQPPVSPQDERTWGLMCHLGGLLFSFVVPLIIYLVYKDRSVFLGRHGAQALNFQLTLLIAWVAGSVLSVIIVGYLLLLAAAAVSIVFSILAAMAANRGEDYVYPIAIPFFRN